MSAFDVDDVVDSANATDGFRGGAGRAARAFGAGAAGAAFADETAGGFAGFTGGVAWREIGRGLGSGTANAPYETSAIAPAPSTAAVQRTIRADPADEGANGITGGLCGESFKTFAFRSISLNMWTKHQMC